VIVVALSVANTYDRIAAMA